MGCSAVAVGRSAAASAAAAFLCSSSPGGTSGGSPGHSARAAGAASPVATAAVDPDAIADVVGSSRAGAKQPPPYPPAPFIDVDPGAIIDTGTSDLILPAPLTAHIITAWQSRPAAVQQTTAGGGGGWFGFGRASPPRPPNCFYESSCSVPGARARAALTPLTIAFRRARMGAVGGGAAAGGGGGGSSDADAAAADAVASNCILVDVSVEALLRCSPETSLRTASPPPPPPPPTPLPRAHTHPKSAGGSCGAGHCIAALAARAAAMAGGEGGGDWCVLALRAHGGGLDQISGPSTGHGIASHSNVVSADVGRVAAGGDSGAAGDAGGDDDGTGGDGTSGVGAGGGDGAGGDDGDSLDYTGALSSAILGVPLFLSSRITLVGPSVQSQSPPTWVGSALHERQPTVWFGGRSHIPGDSQRPPTRPPCCGQDEGNAACAGPCPVMAPEPLLGGVTVGRFLGNGSGWFYRFGVRLVPGALRGCLGLAPLLSFVILGGSACACAVLAMVFVCRSGVRKDYSAIL